ncbi:proton-conducting transporter membrane subunit [Devosia sp.]|uniref:proton-conducting transporter transmembrane domain-containing protein n=1 Tax=Devosia sp. TaxID=1871048 RepID=UPI002EED71B6
MDAVMFATATAAADWVLILPVVLPLVGGAILLMLRSARDLQWSFAVAVTAGVLICDLLLLGRTLAAGPLSMTMGNWLPPFGISFTADSLSATFAATAAALTLLLLVYLQMDVPERARRDGVYPLVLLLLAGVGGSFLTGDLFNLYVWFEVMLIASFGLMVLGGREIQLDATVKYGIMNFLATSLFLLSLGLLYGALGTLNMADITLRAGQADPAVMAGIAALLLLAFGTKAAAFPVNTWLPASYHAPPAAVSALLGGLLTKVGVYALLRSLVMLLPASREVLAPAIALAAILTLVLAPLGAIAETNLRRAIGFMLIGGVGATLVGIAVPGPASLAGSAVYVLHAMLTVTALYLVAGLIEKASGQTDTRRMGGLYAASSPLSLIFLVLVLSISGIPPSLGFWPKLLLLEGSLDASGLAGAPGAPLDWWGVGLAAAVLLNAFLTTIAGTRLWAHIFWREGPEGAQSEVPNPALRPLTRRETWLGLVPTAVLAGVVVAVALLPNPLLEAGRAAARDLLAPQNYIDATRLGGMS